MDVLRVFGACLLGLASCIASSPEEERREALGPYEDGDEEHRPGQPCLTCHSKDYAPGDAVFVVAGTVYASALDDDESGLMGAEVVLTDAEGREFTAVTNSAGNFMVQVRGSDGSVERGERGRARIGFEPRFPLSALVRHGEAEVEMESLIWRDGSCAGCHRGSEATVDSVEKVFVFEEAP